MFFYNIFSILLTNRKQCCIIYKVNNFGFDRAKDTRVTDLQRAAVWCKAVAVRNIELSLEPSTERLFMPSRKNGCLPLQRKAYVSTRMRWAYYVSQSEWYREVAFVSVFSRDEGFFYFKSAKKLPYFVLRQGLFRFADN